MHFCTALREERISPTNHELSEVVAYCCSTSVRGKLMRRKLNMFIYDMVQGTYGLEQISWSLVTLHNSK